MKPFIMGLALAVAGCASDIMQGYVGRDITAVIANYGEPYRRFDLPDGRVAYQWRITEVTARPSEVQYEHDQEGGNVTGRVTSLSGYTTSETCYYTFYTQIAGRSAQITAFETPTFDCE